MTAPVLFGYTPYQQAALEMNAAAPQPAYAPYAYPAPVMFAAQDQDVVTFAGETHAEERVLLWQPEEVKFIHDMLDELLPGIMPQIIDWSSSEPMDPILEMVKKLIEEDENRPLLSERDLLAQDVHLFDAVLARLQESCADGNETTRANLMFLRERLPTNENLQRVDMAVLTDVLQGVRDGLKTCIVEMIQQNDALRKQLGLSEVIKVIQPDISAEDLAALPVLGETADTL